MDHATNPIKVNPSDVAAIAALRRDIHAHPELGYQEERTADLIAKKLTDFGIPVHRGLGKTGVVGIVKHVSGRIRSDRGGDRCQHALTMIHAS